jgi:hypothetical protein
MDEYPRYMYLFNTFLFVDFGLLRIFLDVPLTEDHRASLFTKVGDGGDDEDDNDSDNKAFAAFFFFLLFFLFARRFREKPEIIR